MIDYKALAERIEASAKRQIDGARLSAAQENDEQAKRFEERAADLRTVVSLLNGMADAAPIYAYEWDTYNGGVHRSFRSAPWNGRYPDRVLVLYTHPAPQPQPTEATLKLRLHFDDDEDGPLEIVAHGSKRDMAFLETRIGYWQRLDDRFGKGGPTEAGFTLDQLADACMAAEIPDSKYESLCIALAEERKAAPQPQPERQPVSEPTEAQIERLHNALVIAEAALADIGDADREPGDDLAWCEQRAAEALPTIRAALAAKEQPK